MSDFALITFKGEHKEKLNRSNFLKYFLSWVRNILLRPVLEKYIGKIELYEDLNVYTIKLPYYIDEINRYKGKLNKFITKFVTENNIRYCFFPHNTPDNIQLNGCIRFSSTGKLLYKSVLMDILNEIYTKRGVEVSELDVCIVEGDSKTELYEIIDLLSPFVKFITIAAKNRDSVETVKIEMSRVYDDTGLSVRITSEYKNCFKDTDVIINLGGLAGTASNFRVNPNAVILNCSSDEIDKFGCENILINGFTVNINGNILHKIDDEIFKTYDETGLVEIILFFKAGVEDKIFKEYIDKAVIKGLSGAFDRCRCSVKEFIGRRNKLKVKDIRI